VDASAHVMMKDGAASDMLSEMSAPLRTVRRNNS